VCNVCVVGSDGSSVADDDVSLAASLSVGGRTLEGAPERARGIKPNRMQHHIYNIGSRLTHLDRLFTKLLNLLLTSNRSLCPLVLFLSLILLTFLEQSLLSPQQSLLD